jgi:hypothetical protein
MPPAHVGHWIAELLYLVPVIVVVGWIVLRALLDRRRAGPDPGTDAEPAP